MSTRQRQNAATTGLGGFSHSFSTGVSIVRSQLLTKHRQKAWKRKKVGLIYKDKKIPPKCQCSAKIGAFFRTAIHTSVRKDIFKSHKFQNRKIGVPLTSVMHMRFSLGCWEPLTWLPSRSLTPELRMSATNSYCPKLIEWKVHLRNSLSSESL